MAHSVGRRQRRCSGRRHEGMCRVTSRNRLSAAARHVCCDVGLRFAAALFVRPFGHRLTRHPQAPGRNFDLAAGLRSIHWTHRPRFAPPPWPVALELGLSDPPESGPSAGCAETPRAKASVKPRHGSPAPSDPFRSEGLGIGTHRAHPLARRSWFRRALTTLQDSTMDHAEALQG